MEGLQSSIDTVSLHLGAGNGDGGCVRSCNFYGALERALHSRGLQARLPEGGMPDPLRAREGVWVPFVLEQLGGEGEGSEGGGRAVVVGHSSGAVCALRVAERTRLAGVVLVAAYDDPLGDALEAASGYFDRPFDWELVRANCGFIVQLAGARDSLVPIEVQRRVAQSLQLGDEGAYVYVEHADEDHFFSGRGEEIAERIVASLELAA